MNSMYDNNINLRADEEHLDDPVAAALELGQVRFMVVGVLRGICLGLLGVFFVDAELAYEFRAAAEVAAARAEPCEADDAAAAENACAQWNQDDEQRLGAYGFRSRLCRCRGGRGRHVHSCRSALASIKTQESQCDCAADNAVFKCNSSEWLLLIHLFGVYRCQLPLRNAL